MAEITDLVRDYNICSAGFESLNIVHRCGVWVMMFCIAARIAVHSDAVDAALCPILRLIEWLWGGTTIPTTARLR